MTSTTAIPDSPKTWPKGNRRLILTADARFRRKYWRRFNRVGKIVAGYTRNADLGLLKRAYQFAFEAHKAQLRKSGTPYIEHCLETSKILAELRMDVNTVATGLLHDVVEDGGVAIDEVKERFGDEIGNLVDGVTKISELKYQTQAEKQAENFRKMILSMAQDLRVIIIKFADRLHNMRTLQYLPAKTAERIALETLEVYAPLAHRFGVARVKWELEDLSLLTLDPQMYYSLSKKVAERKERREQYIRRIVNPIRKTLEQNGIHAEVHGRAKSLYSIYRKIKERNKPFEDIHDLLAIRIIVKNVEECYAALGIVHTLFVPVQDQFKDYVATPKMNRYQSLHTTVIGPEGKMVETQVRTEEMHRVAEIGIAAHWKYKEGKQSEDELDHYSTWLREMVDWQKDTMDPEEFFDIFKTDLFISEIFVFTPKGDLIKLPVGATPIDFAFAVHTDVGMHCIGAKVNDRIVQLNTPLKNGDRVSIITSANQRPHQDWITYAKTSKAKSKIKRFLRENQFHEAVNLGQELLSRGLKKIGVHYSKKQLTDFCHSIGKSNLEKFYAELGQGELSLPKILESLVPTKEVHPETKQETLLERFPDRALGPSQGVRVQGMSNLLIRYALCCHPVPGDSVIGFVTKGRGIVVHRRDCVNTKKFIDIPDRSVDVEWDGLDSGSFVVSIHILAEGRKDFLKDVTKCLLNLETSIVRMSLNTENSTVSAYLTLEVHNLLHVTKIIQKVKRIKGVLSVERRSVTETMAEDLT